MESHHLTMLCVALGFALLWVLYLIKVVLNDEAIQEKIRQIQRIREEKRREMEDKARRKRMQQEETASGVKDILKNTGGQPRKPAEGGA